jgi:hypothetical protein
MLKSALLILSLFAFCAVSSAQVKKKIKKGRRNKSESQFTIDKGYVQAEWEIGKEKINSQLSTTVYPNLVLHYGISKRTEINAELSFIAVNDRISGMPVKTRGFEPLSAGASYLLVKESKNIPAVIFSAQLAIPTIAGKNFTAAYWAPLLQVNIQKPVKQELVLGLSTGVFWDGFSTAASFIYNFNGAWDFSKHWKATAEIFGFVNNDPPQHNADAGLAYVVNKQFEFGLTAGTGLSEAAHQNYFSVNAVCGFQALMKKKENKIGRFVYPASFNFVSKKLKQWN